MFAFPVYYNSYSVLSQITISTVLLNGKIGGVYRINGSCSAESLVGNASYIALPWAPATPFTNTAQYWVNQPTLYTFKQSINITGIIPFSYSNTIKMGATLMPSTDTAPSTTFTSAYLNIFSNYSNPLVDNSSKCINPFAYTYSNSYKIWVLWCPVKVGFTNQILFNYPLYPDALGANFPLSTIFTYAYAATTGAMIGYRI